MGAREHVLDSEQFVTVASVACAGQKMGYEMTMGNTCVPDTQTGQDNFLFDRISMSIYGQH